MLAYDMDARATSSDQGKENISDVRNLFGVPGEGFFEGQNNDNLELLKAWAGTTLAFAILQSGGTILDRSFLIDLLISGIV